ncbi:citrate/2-methylcitrate synthase [Xenophilus azovorans]|uniref:citrate/2-methylcitrate synthase n=1 Tax=Xenophilus azovorans TaxID=151755 RepID=UPI0005706FB7|nr:citrate/2-methylcitrate synthase [Xenophilus azovorans]
MSTCPDPTSGRQPDFLDAKASLALLGVRPQTLYAYVSRGAIRSVPQPGTKAHLYSRSDIERVVARAAARAGHAAAAAGAMDHGPPIVSSGITEITEAGPAYRGYLASDLARQGVPFERVCELLWGAPLDVDRASAWRIPPRDQALAREAGLRILHGADPHRVYGSLAMLALQLERTLRMSGGGAQDAGVAQEARLLICAVAQALGCVGPARALTLPDRSESIASTLIRSFGCETTPARIRAVNALLVLLADHELPPGTLAVRAAASGGANLFDCIAVGICASAGTEIAGHYAVVDRFLTARPSATALRDKALRLHQRAQRIPGFTHPLYMGGDPRARHLLAIAAELADDSFNMRQVTDFVGWAQENLADHPRHEFAVVCLVRALRLPVWSAAVFFLVARMAGWAAHVEEQRSVTGLWRPRARYVPRP